MGCNLSKFLCPRDSPSKNVWVGCRFLVQGIFLTQGFNMQLLPHLLYCRQIPYHWTTGESPWASLGSHYSAYQWKWKSLSRVWIFATPGAIQPMEFFRPRVLEWVAFPFSRRSSQPRNWTSIFCLAGDSLPTELSGKPSLPESLLI